MNRFEAAVSLLLGLINLGGVNIKNFLKQANVPQHLWEEKKG